MKDSEATTKATGKKVAVKNTAKVNEAAKVEFSPIIELAKYERPQIVKNAANDFARLYLEDVLSPSKLFAALRRSPDMVEKLLNECKQVNTTLVHKIINEGNLAALMDYLSEHERARLDKVGKLTPGTFARLFKRAASSKLETSK